MNDIQKKLLEIAKEYIKVCEKLNLRYFTLGGTALGAVRHNGFIPWDDDIDFCMPRKDYEIFVNEGQKLLPKHLFIQTYKTDRNYISPFGKVRDSNTTAIENANKDIDMNHGLWIDVFPLDGLPSSKRKRKFYAFIDNGLLRRRYSPSHYYSKRFRSKIANFFIKIILPSKRLALKWSIKLSTKYDYDKCELFWWNWGTRGKREIKREWFDNFTMLDFEDIKIRVPYMYDEYLIEHYGDWKKLPPLEQRVSVHNLYLVDLNKSYKEYSNEKSKF